jgi:phosphoadenosine phosphosulfate reductase
MLDAAFTPLHDDLQLLDQVSRGASAPDFLRLAIRGAYRDRIALVVSDGAVAPVLLHMVAGIDRSLPVIVPDAPIRSVPAAQLGLRNVQATASLEHALDAFEAWIDGRARSTSSRHRPLVDIVDGRLRLDPLAMWSADDIDAYLTTNDLPRIRGLRPHHH